MTHRDRKPRRTSLIRRRAVVVFFSALTIASCGGETPLEAPIAEVSAKLLNACGASVTASTLLAQPNGDLCAPHFGPTDYSKRECVFDKNEVGDPLDGDQDLCTGLTWNDSDISGLTRATGATRRFWAITDKGAKTRTRCGGTCSSGEDVIDPVNGDCSSGQDMVGSKWLFLLDGTTSPMSIAGQTLIVGGTTGAGNDVKVEDPESISRFTRNSGGEFLLMVDGGLHGGDGPDACNARGVCRAVKTGAGSPTHCITDPVHDSDCNTLTTEAACTAHAGTLCAFIKEPTDSAISRDDLQSLVIMNEPNVSNVVANGRNAYNTLCVQPTNSDASEAAVVYFDFPKVGCGGVGASYPCPPEAASYPASAGIFNIEASAVIKEKDGVSTFHSVLLFSKPPLWKLSAQNATTCGGGRIYRDVGGNGSGMDSNDVRIDHGYTSVFKIANIDQYSIGSVAGSHHNPSLTATLIAQLDLEQDLSTFVSQQGQRISDAAYVGDPNETDAGWLVFGSQSRLYKRRYKTGVNTINKLFFSTSTCEATQVSESPSGSTCSGTCIPEFESISGEIASGVLTTFHAGESGHKVDSSGVQQPISLARVVQNDSRRIAFVTSTTYDANLGGIAGANAKCQARALAGGLPNPSGYKAWISTSTTNAAANITHHNSFPYVKTDGAEVASSWTDLVDGTLTTAVDRDELGAVQSVSCWTGTASNGTAVALTCSGWTSNSSGASGEKGSTSATNATWTDSTSANCSATHHLYCFDDN